MHAYWYMHVGRTRGNLSGSTRSKGWNTTSRHPAHNSLPPTRITRTLPPGRGKSSVRTVRAGRAAQNEDASRGSGPHRLVCARRLQRRRAARLCTRGPSSCGAPPPACAPPLCRCPCWLPSPQPPARCRPRSPGRTQARAPSAANRAHCCAETTQKRRARRRTARYLRLEREARRGREQAQPREHWQACRHRGGPCESCR